MRILILGAGVIGSFNAARLTEAGQEVTLLARGRRLADLREYGVVLENFRTGRRTITRVPLVDRLAPDDAYDLAIVVVRVNHIPSILPALAQNHRIPSVLFLGNNAAGPQELIKALGRERVLMGLANAGGAREGHVVRYLWWRWMPLLFGELENVRTPRTEVIVRLFRSAGVSARVVKNVDAYLKTHAVGLPALAGAVYMAGGNVRQFAHTRDALKLFLRAFREALRALHAIGIPLKPSGTRLMEWIPEPILLLLLRHFFDSRLADMGAQPHLDAAADELKELADEVRTILRRSGLPSPASDLLYAHVEAQFQALGSRSTTARPSPIVA
ncbi:MAG TPA: 2-dehydropantoate 2-reductase N-terminal domain-containing protein [Terriglobales bacterium]|nr:2-dehydropantoate 2-reductase N-terminal domain-containing protein [Terriglobales bacterium]